MRRRQASKVAELCCAESADSTLAEFATWAILELSLTGAGTFMPMAEAATWRPWHRPASADILKNCPGYCEIGSKRIADISRD
jgi:hypothetical protein